MNVIFESVSAAELNSATAQWLDELPFGVIGFSPGSIVTAYNATESAQAGLSANRVLGRHLFEEVAPCMNNFMVAQRFEDEPQLDAVIPYVLTLRMRPTPVRLRLLNAPDATCRYILIERKAAQ
jgi:photoactive yellow protein